MSYANDMRVRRVVGTTARLAALAAVCFLCIFPYLWSLKIAMKVPGETGMSLENFTTAWSSNNLAGFTLNTLIYSTATATCVTAFATMGGYAFGRLRFPGRDVLFKIMIALIMIPSAVLVIPLVLMLFNIPLVGGNDLRGDGGLGLYDTRLGLILPGIVAMTFTFLMRQMFYALPRDLEDAARIDGAGELQIFLRIILPLMRPAMATVFMLQFLESWNAFLWPLIIGQSQAVYTLPVGLANLSYQAATARIVSEGVVHASAIISSIPVILIVLFGQRYFRRGVVMTGFK